MKILVLGHAASRANEAKGVDRSWSELLQERLTSITGAPVVLETRRFVPYFGDQAEYVGRQLEQHQPDVVIMQCSPATYVFPWVQLRVRRLAGDHIGGAYLWAERQFDRYTRKCGKPGYWLNWHTRLLVHRTVGAEAVTNEDRALAGFLAAFRRLAREEELQVAIIGPSYHSARAQRMFPKLRVQTDRFNRVLGAAAREHRFAWVDSELAAQAVRPNREAAFLGDGQYRTPAGQAALMAAVLTLFTDGTITLREPEDSAPARS